MWKELNEVGKESIKSTTDIIYEKCVEKYQNEPTGNFGTERNNNQNKT